MSWLMKLSRVNNTIKPMIGVTSRNSSHFTYVPDAPMENMGKFKKSRENTLAKAI